MYMKPWSSGGTKLPGTVLNSPRIATMNAANTASASTARFSTQVTPRL